uniref:Putative transglutaminase-family protein n=1 Tax=Siphoviridae sp. ctj912 TaxID=2827920 RepID=A0A8S5SP67_9CAUD|nr:MAG TPA: putative transglutaminase-family protein [Siphoviridae sp. ctj912]
MTATIKGRVKSPTGQPVTVTITATPNPNPTRTPDGDLIVPGSVMSEGDDGHVTAELRPGRYVVSVASPTGLLAERDVTLTDGQTMTLGDLLTATPTPGDAPAPVPGGTPLVDEHGKPIALADIKIVNTRAEAEPLPDGAVYLLTEQADAPGHDDHGETKPNPAAGPTLVAHAAGQHIGDTITIRTDGQAGDRTVIAVNTKAVNGQSFTFPDGFAVLVEPYWIGTMRFTVAVGPWAPELTVRTSQPVEAAWAAVNTRGGGTPVVGQVKKRQAEPTETGTCTAPEVPATTGLTLGLAFERTTAPETADQVTINQGWERLEFAAQEGSNLQTLLVARRTAPAGDLTVTYPNTQTSNGAGVQVVVPLA